MMGSLAAVGEGKVEFIGAAIVVRQQGGLEQTNSDGRLRKNGKCSHILSFVTSEW